MPVVIRSTVAVLGDPQTGKSALLNTVCGNGGQQALQPTMRPDVFKKQIKVPGSDYIVDLILIDCPSHHLSFSLTKKAIAECQQILVLSSFLSTESLSNITKWVEMFRDATMIPKVSGVAAISYAYEDSSQFTFEEAERQAKSLGLGAVQCNPVTGRDCDTPFAMLAHLAHKRFLKNGE